MLVTISMKLKNKTKQKIQPFQIFGVLSPSSMKSRNNSVNSNYILLCIVSCTSRSHRGVTKFVLFVTRKVMNIFIPQNKLHALELAYPGYIPVPLTVCNVINGTVIAR